jgi:hypothetical protein
MAEQTPLFVDTDGTYGADELGLPFRDLMGEGVVEDGDLAVSQHAAGANMQVDVAAGACWIKGDTDSNLQPTYRCYNDAVKSVTLDAADATNPRIDLIIAQVNDSAFTGSQKGFVIDKVTGTPAATPAEPALPDTAIKLAVIDVAANASSIVTADITDTRPRASVGAGVARGGAAAGHFDTPGATGAYAVTGLGFKPRLVTFVCQFADSTAAASFSEGRAWLSNDGSTIEEFLTGMRSTSTANERATRTDACIGAYTGGAWNTLASMSSFDDDGFTVNFTQVGATSVYWTAWA